MSSRLGRHQPLPRPAEPPYERAEVSVGKARQSTHYVIALSPDVAPDIVRFLRVSIGYHLGDGLPLCGNDGDQHPPLPSAQPCGSCQSYLEIFEGDLDDARWAKAEETLAWSAIDDAVRAAIRAQPDRVGW
jgi:hypothetical protein